MKSKNKFNIKILGVIVICIITLIIIYYNSDNVKFSRFLNKIKCIKKEEIKVIHVYYAKNNIPYKTDINNSEAYIMFDLLQGIKDLEHADIIHSGIDYCYKIKIIMETKSKEIYSIQFQVSKNSYNIKLNEVSIDLNKSKKATKDNAYFMVDEKAKVVLKKILKPNN